MSVSDAYIWRFPAVLRPLTGGAVPSGARFSRGRSRAEVSTLGHVFWSLFPMSRIATDPRCQQPGVPVVASSW